MSFPRMERTVAVVSVNVTTVLELNLDLASLQSVYYDDFKVVIAYIHNESHRFHVYVSNSMQYIHVHTS